MTFGQLRNLILGLVFNQVPINAEGLKKYLPDTVEQESIETVCKWLRLSDYVMTRSYGPFKGQLVVTVEGTGYMKCLRDNPVARPKYQYLANDATSDIEDWEMETRLAHLISDATTSVVDESRIIEMLLQVMPVEAQRRAFNDIQAEYESESGADICSDCGEEGHTKGAMECQYPQDEPEEYWGQAPQY